MLLAVQSHTKHRHQVHILIISVSVILLFYITVIKHVKLRNTDNLLLDNSPENRKVDSFQEFDYDVELTEEERRILKKSFKSADFDNNKLLTESEVAMAINRETNDTSEPRWSLFLDTRHTMITAQCVPPYVLIKSEVVRHYSVLAGPT